MLSPVPTSEFTGNYGKNVTVATSDPSTARPRRVLIRRPSRRVLAFLALLLVYLLVTLGVIYRSPLLTLDTDLFKLDLQRRYPDWKPWIKVYVMLGQRGPATLLFLPWFLWVAWRNRTPRPLIMLAVALVLLNLSVGVVKLATGRLGPLQTSNTHRIFDGGNIYPSGHVSNAMVLYGLLAIIAINHRRTAAVVAGFLSVTVGLSTVYRDTHWFSDVVGGWIAGGLVLIAIPWAMPPAMRVWDWLWSRVAPRVPWLVERLAAAPEPSAPGPSVTAPAAPGTAKPGPGNPGRAVARPTQRQPTVTPVSSVAAANSLSATRTSLDARDESTRRGKPRTSPIPSGP
jgi:membrane-associated phospholipid phosphatase